MSNANTPEMMAQSMAESLFRENARLKKIEESYYRLLELDSGDVMIDTLNELDRLKEQNALLTVQVQRYEDAQWQQAGWIASWMLRNGMSDNINATAFAELQDHLASLTALTALPQQVKSGDASSPQPSLTERRTDEQNRV